jgi:putative DNA methylase
VDIDYLQSKESPLNNGRSIEQTFPIKEVSIESDEKGIRQGNISSLHIWWARRPLAASRATAYAALIPSSNESAELKRKKEFVAQLSKKSSASNLDVLDKARQEILRNFKGVPPKILDPFGGGAAIPLETLRLGCVTYSSDYNPVSVLILRSILEYPQKYGKSRTKATEDSGAGFLSVTTSALAL